MQSSRTADHLGKTAVKQTTIQRLRETGVEHGGPLAKDCVDGMVQRGADVGVVGDRAHQGHAAGVSRATSA
jgi:hypothetical protein